MKQPRNLCVPPTERRAGAAIFEPIGRRVKLFD